MQTLRINSMRRPQHPEESSSESENVCSFGPLVVLLHLIAILYVLYAFICPSEAERYSNLEGFLSS